MRVHSYAEVEESVVLPGVDIGTLSLGSDLGQANNPFPADSFRKICSRLLEAGLSEREVRMLVADNPARLLGVDR